MHKVKTAYLSQYSRSMMTSFLLRLSIPFLTIGPTFFPWLSCSLAAEIQMAGSLGSTFRALFRMVLAESSLSSRAHANHNSTWVGQHSTARDRRIRASSWSASSTAAFQSATELGIFSRAFLSTLLCA